MRRSAARRCARFARSTIAKAKKGRLQMAEIESTQAQPVKTTTNVLYLLHALAPFTAWILAVVAIVIGMVTRDDVRGTYLESHYSWLARTFWWGLLWIAISYAVFCLKKKKDHSIRKMQESCKNTT